MHSHAQMLCMGYLSIASNMKMKAIIQIKQFIVIWKNIRSLLIGRIFCERVCQTVFFFLVFCSDKIKPAIIFSSNTQTKKVSPLIYIRLKIPSSMTCLQILCHLFVIGTMPTISAILAIRLFSFSFTIAAATPWSFVFLPATEWN